MIYRFIEEHKNQWPVRWLCETLEVSTASYYAWRQDPRSVGEQRRHALLVEIRAIHAEFKTRYGSPRIHAELVARGHDCCVNTVAKLMRQAGIAAKTARKFRCTTTDSNHDLPVAENLLDRQFDPEAPNEAWVADITYIPTREGWLYLAAVEDLYSRRVVGWSMADHLESRLVVDALALAVFTDAKNRAFYFQEFTAVGASWNEVHLGLQHGDAKLNLPPNNDPVIAQDFQNLQPQYNAILKAYVDVEQFAQTYAKSHPKAPYGFDASPLVPDVKISMNRSAGDAD